MVERRKKLLSPSDIIQKIYNHTTHAYQVTDTIIDNARLASCNVPDEERSRRLSLDISHSGAQSSEFVIPDGQGFRTKHISMTDTSASPNSVKIEYTGGIVIWTGVLQANQNLEVPFGFGAGPEIDADEGTDQDILVTSTGAVTITLHGDALVA